MPVQQVAGALFSRWSQENFFKYLRERFNLDALPSHDLQPLDPNAQVVNPVRRALEQTIRRVRSRLAAARDRLAVALQEQRRDTATRLEDDATALAGELDALKQQRADLPTHVRAGDLPEQDKYRQSRHCPNGLRCRASRRAESIDSRPRASSARCGPDSVRVASTVWASGSRPSRARPAKLSDRILLRRSPGSTCFTISSLASRALIVCDTVPLVSPR